MNNITAVILAGGKSTRMKQDKALVKINDKTLLSHQIDKLSPIFDKIIISANTNYNCNLRIINDIDRDKGPIGGIYTVLQNINTEKAFIIAVDMPFVNEVIIKKLIDNSFYFDITIPIIDGKTEPTCAVYSKNCINTIKKQLADNNYRLTDFISISKTNYINFTKNNLDCFKNLNSPEDLG